MQAHSLNRAQRAPATFGIGRAESGRAGMGRLLTMGRAPSIWESGSVGGAAAAELCGAGEALTKPTAKMARTKSLENILSKVLKLEGALV